MFENKLRKNFLLLIGGAEDRKEDKLVLSTLVKKTAAKYIIVIPTASHYSREVINTYYDAFHSLGVQTIEGFDIMYPDEVDRPEFLEKIELADLVFFSGGDQKRLVEILDGSRLLQRIKERFFDGSLHIAGTSAGAAAASDPITYDGDYNGFKKGSISYSKGFGLIPDVTIDTHFLNRERIPRLTQFLATGLSTKGIGLCEDTMIIVDPELRFEVVGSGMVTLINSDKITFNNYSDISNDELVNVNNIRIGFLSNGAKFSIKRWSVLKSDDKKKEFEDDWLERTLTFN